MSDETENDDNGDMTYTAEAQFGQLSVSVEGDDPEATSERAGQQLQELIERAEEIGIFDSHDTYHVEAGAGWLMAHGDADTPEEAYAQWLDMWERMIEDVKQLEGSERAQAGVSREL
jgi:FAD/FMN-containing dehydrogenase